MNFTKLSKIALTASAILMGSANLAFAAGSTNCEIVYGGGQVCTPQIKFTIDKKIQKPTKGGGFVDNLGANDDKFNPGQDVVFQITVQNTGDQAVTLNVVDVLPSYITFVSGGNFDSGSNKVTNQVSLNPNDSKTFTIATRVVNAGGLPANQSVTCVTNVANAMTTDNNNSAQDTAQFCIQNNVTVQPQIPSKSIPNTGPEALALLILPPVGAAGFYLRRKAVL
ncbi:MAG: hypothetical protein ACM3IJ_04545 [Candidatus Levyibacteriota bacterium]